MTVGRIEPFIVTLGSLGIFRALITFLANGGTLNLNMGASDTYSPLYSGKIAINNDSDWTDAHRRVIDNEADAISVGRLFIANPDLVERIARGAPLNESDSSTYYRGGAKGYVDYPLLGEAAAA